MESIIKKWDLPETLWVDLKFSKVKQDSRTKITNVSVAFLNGSIQLMDLYFGPRSHDDTKVHEELLHYNLRVS